MTSLTTGATSRRIEAIDAVRGFALALIATVHMFERYLASIPPKGVFGKNPGALNKFLSLVQPLLSGKGFAIFSILFGLSFFIMMSNAAKRGTDFRARFLWRLSILFVIGYLHALFFRGDILTIYAILGAILVLFFNASNKTLGLVMFLVLAGVPRFILFYFLGGDAWLPGSEGGPASPLNVAYVQAVTGGSLLDVFRSNAWDGHKWFFYIQFDQIGRGYLAFCYFLAGLWIGRIGLFQRLEEYKPRIKRAFFTSLALAIPATFGALFAAMQVFSKGFEVRSWSAVFTLVAFDFANTLMAVMLFTGFLLAYLTLRGERVLGIFAPFGRMALSNYVLQTLIGTFIFYNWGLDLMAKVRHTHVALFTMALITAQMVFSTVWMRQFQYGPLEWLWRSATDRRWQPMLKTHSATPAVVDGAAQSAS